MNVHQGGQLKLFLDDLKYLGYPHETDDSDDSNCPMEITMTNKETEGSVLLRAHRRDLTSFSKTRRVITAKGKNM